MAMATPNRIERNPRGNRAIPSFLVPVECCVDAKNEGAIQQRQPLTREGESRF
jgi:hypothetical protein